MKKLISPLLSVLAETVPFAHSRVRFLSALILIAANSLLLPGIILFDWKFSSVLFIYWVESGIIGSFNILKMITCGLFGGKEADPVMRFTKTAGLTGFFIIHFGGFMGGHALFLLILFDVEFRIATSFDGPLGFFDSNLFSLLALTVSNGLLFVLIFLKGRQFAGKGPEDFFVQPYGRVFPMHIILIVGGLIAVSHGQPGVYFTMFWIALKTLSDILMTMIESRDAVTGPAPV